MTIAWAGLAAPIPDQELVFHLGADAVGLLALFAIGLWALTLAARVSDELRRGMRRVATARRVMGRPTPRPARVVEGDRVAPVLRLLPGPAPH